MIMTGRRMIPVDVDAMVFWRQEGLTWPQIQAKMHAMDGHPRVSTSLIRQRVLAVDSSLTGVRLKSEPMM